MKRTRTIAAAPVRSASEAWGTVMKLIADTLERSSAISDGTVAAELASLDGLGPALIAGGHLEERGLVLVDYGLHLTIAVVTGDRALSVDENLNPVPGGMGATNDWVLYLPSPDPLVAATSAAAKKSVHLSVESPPSAPPEPADKSDGSRQSELDLDALRRLRSQP
jgi:hypothetical protein